MEYDAPLGVRARSQQFFSDVRRALANARRTHFENSDVTIIPLPTQVDLQVGDQCFEDVAASMRTQLWLSAVHKAVGVGPKAMQEYAALAATDGTGAESRIPESVRDAVAKDVPRTYPELAAFRSGSAGDAGRERLYRVLCAYAHVDPEVGYCQGMGFVAGLLLLYLREAEAFAAFCVLMRDAGLRELYLEGFGALQLRMWQLTAMVPVDLSEHLESHGVTPVLFASGWFLTSFGSEAEVSFACRVLDRAFSRRSAPEAILRAGVAILRDVRMEALAESDFERLVGLLRGTIRKPYRDGLRFVLHHAYGVNAPNDKIPQPPATSTPSSRAGRSGGEVDRASSTKSHFVLPPPPPAPAPPAPSASVAVLRPPHYPLPAYGTTSMGVATTTTTTTRSTTTPTLLEVSAPSPGGVTPAGSNPNPNPNGGGGGGTASALPDLIQL